MRLALQVLFQSGCIIIADEHSFQIHTLRDLMNNQFLVAGGLILLIIAIVILISPPSVLFSQTIQIIDTEFTGSSGDEQHVRTMVDFGDTQVMENLPLEETGWTRITEDLSNTEQQLGADILLAWRCHHVSSSNRIWFLILQSKDVSSFHPPPVCYAALGYEILQEDTIDIAVSGDRWAATSSVNMLSEGLFFSGTMSTKRLVIAKDCDGRVCDKRVVLYFYIKPNISETPNEITMVRVSAVVPANGSFDSIQELETKLIADAFPLMFESSNKERSLGEWLVEEWGIAGWITIAVAIMVPTGLLTYSIIRKRIHSKSAPVHE